MPDFDALSPRDPLTAAADALRGINPKRSAAQRQAQLLAQNRPEVRAKKSASHKLRVETPEGKAQIARMLSAAYAPETRARATLTRRINRSRRRLAAARPDLLGWA